MTVMSENLYLNSKCSKMGCEEGDFQAFLTQPPIVNICHTIQRLSIYGSATVRRA